MKIRTLYEHEDLRAIFDTESVYIDGKYMHESRINIDGLMLHIDGLDIEITDCVVRTPWEGVASSQVEEKIFRELLALR